MNEGALEGVAFPHPPNWSTTRARVYGRRPRRCAACRSCQHIDLHHLTYERWGKELDDDLIPLCHDCHAAVHQMFRALRKTRMTLRAVTLRYVTRCRRPTAGELKAQTSFLPWEKATAPGKYLRRNPHLPARFRRNPGEVRPARI